VKLRPSGFGDLQARVDMRHRDVERAERAVAAAVRRYKAAPTLANYRDIADAVRAFILADDPNGERHPARAYDDIYGRHRYRLKR